MFNQLDYEPKTIEGFENTPVTDVTYFEVCHHSFDEEPKDREICIKYRYNGRRAIARLWVSSNFDDEYLETTVKNVLALTGEPSENWAYGGKPTESQTQNN